MCWLLLHNRNSMRPPISRHARGLRITAALIALFCAAAAQATPVYQFRVELDASMSRMWVVGGELTLDDMMDRLQACCLPSSRVWTGPELFARLDALAGYPVFMPLYRRYADTAGFPDTRPLFERLGLQVANDTLQMHGGSELQQIRIAITRKDPDVAKWRRQPVLRQRHAFRTGATGSR